MQWLVLVAVLALFGNPAAAAPYTVWNESSYGVSAFNAGAPAFPFVGGRLTAAGETEVREYFKGNSLGEVGLTGYYKEILVTALERQTEIPVVNVASPADFEREAWRQYESKFQRFGNIRVLVVQGAMPGSAATPAEYDVMAFRKASEGGRVVTLPNVFQTFRANVVMAIFLDETLMKGISWGAAAKCHNPLRRAFVVIVDRKIEYKEKEVVRREEVPVFVEREKIVERIVERKVEVPVDRVVEVHHFSQNPFAAQCANRSVGVQYLDQRPGVIPAVTGILGTLGGLASPFLWRGTNISIGGPKAFAAGGSATSSSTSTNNIGVQNQNNNANSNVQAQGQSGR